MGLGLCLAAGLMLLLDDFVYFGLVCAFVSFCFSVNGLFGFEVAVWW